MSIVGCRTIEEAAKYSREFWWGQHGFGRTVAIELESRFMERGISYGVDPGAKPKFQTATAWMLERQRSIYRENGNVYFIKPDGIEKVKIGFASTTVKQRLAALQTGSCELLRVIGVIEEGGRALEAELHERFKGDRLHLEWFRFSEPIQNYIKTNCASPVT